MNRMAHPHPGLRKTQLLHLGLLLALFLLLILPVPAIAQTMGYSLDWNTISSGGSLNAAGGSYSLDASIAQPGAGVLSGSGYTLGGGFWPSSAILAAPEYHLFLPLTRR